jgi:hypothetical protein
MPDSPTARSDPNLAGDPTHPTPLPAAGASLDAAAVRAWVRQHPSSEGFSWGYALAFYEDHFASEHDLADEYFGMAPRLSSDATLTPHDEVWPEHCYTTVIVYWIVGGSEGFFVHVDVLVDDPNCPAYRTQHGTALSGKFWTSKRAQHVVQGLQMFFNTSGQLGFAFETVGTDREHL